VKIGQYLAKIWTKYDSLVFLGHPVQHIWRNDDPVAVCSERCCTSGVGCQTVRSHLASATPIALASCSEAGGLSDLHPGLPIAVLYAIAWRHRTWPRTVSSSVFSSSVCPGIINEILWKGKLLTKYLTKIFQNKIMFVYEHGVCRMPSLLSDSLLGLKHTFTFQDYVTSPITWPFDLPYAISYWWSFKTEPLSITLLKMCASKLTFQNHMMSSIGDYSIPQVLFPIGAPLWASPYLQPFSRVETLGPTYWGSQTSPVKVTDVVGHVAILIPG